MASSSLGWGDGALEHTEDPNCSPQALQGWQDLRSVSMNVFEDWAVSTVVWGLEEKSPSGPACGQWGEHLRGTNLWFS